jgi:CubicO group peptidase (beta-lactamase class C family)
MKLKTLECKLVITTITAFVLLLFPITVLGQDAFYHKIDEIVQAEARYDLFSGTMLVAKDGRIIYAKGFGEANKEYHIPNILETKFNISSVQKTFIATVIMQLCQESVISLDDPLAKYFPECPWKSANQICIKNLLNHTSGLADYRDNDEYRVNSEKYKSIDDVLPLIFKLVPDLDPSGKVRYSNAGVLLAKSIIEKVTDRKLEQVLEERIWHPLGMDNTSSLVGGDLLSNRATAYRLSDDGNTYLRRLDEPSAYAGGGIYTTCLDLLKFDQALYGDELINQEYKDIMFTPNDSNMFAHGWIVVEFGGTTVVYHSGSSGGFNSEFRRYPEKGYTLIVLSNYQGAAYQLANKIDCMLLGLPYSVATESDRHYKHGMYFQDQKLYTRAVESFEKNLGNGTPHMPSLYQAARTRILGEFG